jgi:hypothetical protein
LAVVRKGGECRAILWVFELGNGEAAWRPAECLAEVRPALENTAASFHSSVSGGEGNSAPAQSASVSGGRENLAEGLGSAILGGREHVVKAVFGHFP